MEAITEAKNGASAERFKWYAALGLVALSAHAFLFFKFVPRDALLFVGSWYRHILATGPIDAFAHPFANYNPPYLYLLSATTIFDGAASVAFLIKALSWLGAIWLWIAGRRLFAAIGRSQSLALLLLALPSVILNVSMLGQADTFWVAPCVLAVAASIKGRLVWVAIWSGLAFAFKAQAIFLAPFVLHLFVSRRAPLAAWIAAPLTFAACMVPAWLLGWPLIELGKVYLNQANWQPLDQPFISNSASFWTFFSYSLAAEAWRYRWLGFLAALAISTLFVRRSPKVAGVQLIAAAAVSSAIVPFVLPGMHERFFILADVLAAAYAIARPNLRSILAACLIQVASAGPVLVWAFQLGRLEIFAPTLMAVGIVLLARGISSDDMQRAELRDA
ncbi:hypothetical protein [Sphingomonas daechungensis]|uniref:hypothetical protein n=1 Tax=Sphingomonas daechungensis TaxID=1176646 RepID=UPI003783EA82